MDHVVKVDEKMPKKKMPDIAEIIGVADSYIEYMSFVVKAKDHKFSVLVYGHFRCPSDYYERFKRVVEIIRELDDIEVKNIIRVEYQATGVCNMSTIVMQYGFGMSSIRRFMTFMEQDLYKVTVHEDGLIYLEFMDKDP
jgi:hypothetical protein